MKKLLVIFNLIFLHMFMYGQQDPLFTRNVFISDMLYNPASTAMHGDIRAMGAYRNQWGSLVGSPKTFVLNTELPLENIHSGIGCNIFHDAIGFDSHYGIYVNYAYSINLSKNIKMRLGMKGGFSLLTSDFTDVDTPDNQNLDPIYTQNQKVSIPKVGFGIFLHNDKSYFGFSIPYTAASIPNSGFSFAEDNAYLSRHFYATLGHVISTPIDEMEVKPSIFLRYHQSAPLQADISTQVWYKDLFSIGLSYRTNDALAGTCDIALSQNLILSYAYDYTYSDFQSISAGAHECILVYRWQKKSVSIPSIHKFPILPRF